MTRAQKLARLLIDGRTAIEKVHRMTGRRYKLVQDLLDVASPDHQRNFRELVEDLEKKMDKRKPD